MTVSDLLRESAWLPMALRRPSPNHDARPVGVAVDLLVIHSISLPPGQFGGPWIDALFMNRPVWSALPDLRELSGLRVSAHLLIRRGGTLIQYVDLGARAWHAGESSFRGRRACNDFSIGIELEGAEDFAYTREQYASLAATTRHLRELFPMITPDRIVGHSDIAPRRKTDPGPRFDWVAYRRAITDNARSAPRRCGGGGDP